MERILFLFILRLMQIRARRQNTGNVANRIVRRRRVRVPRVFLPRVGLHGLSDREIIQRFRLDRESILHLYREIEDHLEPMTARSQAIPGLLKLLAALHFMATGSFQAVSSVIIGMSQSAFSRHLSKVIGAMMVIFHRYVCLPSTPEEWQSIKSNFYRMAGMPNVLGAIDCTHVAVRPLQAREEIYRNRKHFHSLNVQMVCDPHMRIISVRSNFPGSCHDSYILRQTGLYRKFEDGNMPDGWLLGDGGYSCTEWLLTPYNNPQTRSQVRFNEAHRSTRGIIERTFGLLKMRFRCLDRSGGAMQYAPEKVAKIILVCCILHNIAIKRGCPLEDEDPIDADDLPEEICVEQANRRGNATRDMVSEQYFED